MKFGVSDLRGMSKVKRSYLFIFVVVLAAALLWGCGGPDAEETAREESPSEQEQKESEEKKEEENPPEETGVVNPVTGLEVPEDKMERRPWIAMMDNHPDAVPQYGLSEADLIFEVLVEGGITRFMPVYISAKPDKIGPVRSGRPYCLDIARGWDALFLHAGGSPQFYEEVAHVNLHNIDAMHLGNVYFRSQDASAPHNLYADTGEVRQLAEDRGWAKGGNYQERFQFVEEPLAGTASARRVSVSLSGWLGYEIRFDYDEKVNKYFRYSQGQAHRDRLDGEQLRVGNVIILTAATRRIPGDAKGRLQIDLVGEGDLLAFAAGKMARGSWEKDSAASPIKYRDEEGEMIELGPGRTWILIVPPEAEIETLPAEGGK